MRAIQIKDFGGPEVLQLADVPVPEPGEGEVLIRVSRAGMNYADTHQRTNDYLANYELPLVPGGEVAGVREDTGERVVAMSGLGGYAEYATAPAALTFPIPDGVDDAAALALLKATEPKLSSGTIPFGPEGASSIHSADETDDA